MTRYLAPNNRPLAARKRWIAVDIETHGLGGTFIAGAWRAEDESDHTYFDTIDTWIEAILSKRYRKYVWIAHSGGEYDYKYLIDRFYALIDSGRVDSIEPVIQGNVRVIGFKIKHSKQTVDLRDSYALLPDSLARLSAAFCPELPKMSRDHAVPFSLDDPNDRAYLARDIDSLLAVLLRLDSELVTRFVVHPTWTAGSTAMAAWRRTTTHVEIRRRQEIDDLARRAYYGAYTRILRREPSRDMIMLDVNAMYASVMREGVPHGSGSATRTVYKNRPGIYHIRIDRVPPDALPVLARRVGRRTLYTLQPGETYATSAEIHYARSKGYEISIISGFAFTGLHYPFDAFIALCEALELTNKGNAIGATVKLLRNALYGKFGTRPERERYILAPTMPDGYSLTTDPQTGRVIDHLYWTMESVDDSHMLPHYAAWIIAQGRLRLFSLIDLIGRDSIAYVDTDAIVADRDRVLELCDSGLLSIGPAYGQLKFAHVFDFFRPHGIKQYLAVENGELIKVTRGLPAAALSPENIAQLQRGEPVAVDLTLQRSTRALLMSPTAERTYKQRRSYGSVQSAP